MTTSRIVVSGRVMGVMAALMVAVGCAKPGPEAKPMADAQKPNTIVTPGGPTPPMPVLSIPTGQDPKPAAEAFAKAFLAALKDGTATPAMLTDSFKKLVAPPALPSDKERGFSDLVAADWLKSFTGRTGPDGLTVAAIGVDSVVVAVPPPAGTAALPIGRTVLRVAKVGAEWKADSLYQAPPAGVPIPLTGEGDTLAARFTAAAFVETALMKTFDLTEPLVLPATRAKIGPSLGGDDAARGYNRSILRSKFEAFRGSATGYTVSKTDTVGSTTTVEGELLDGATLKRPFTLKLLRGAKAGEWLVEEFHPR